MAAPMETSNLSIFQGKVGKAQHVCLHDNCGKSFSRKDRLETHQRAHTGERPYACEFHGCEKAYARYAHLVRHKEHAHYGSQKRTTAFLCPHEECGMTFVSQTNLRRHLKRIHENSAPAYKCPHDGCNKIFKKHQHLKTHSYIHTNVKPYKCDHEGCDAAFLMPSVLKRHLKVHEGYTCQKDGCGKHFVKWTLYQQHLSSEHRSEHPCPTCHKTFPHRRILVRHMVIHQETRSVFVCPKEDCTRVYYDKRNLTAHMKSYHSGKRFSCTHEGCDRTYVSKQKMMDHLKVHDPASSISKKKLRKRKSSRKISEAALLSGYDVRKQCKIVPDQEDVIVLPDPVSMADDTVEITEECSGQTAESESTPVEVTLAREPWSEQNQTIHKSCEEDQKSCEEGSNVNICGNKPDVHMTDTNAKLTENTSGHTKTAVGDSNKCISNDSGQFSPRDDSNIEGSGDASSAVEEVAVKSMWSNFPSAAEIQVP